MADMYLGSQLPMYQNVLIQVRNKNTGEVRVERTAKNRVTRLMLWGIARFLSGEFNNSTPDKIYEYIPRFLALGSNVPTSDSSLSGVGTTVTVNDTRLLNEHTVLNSMGDKEPIRRIDIQGRNHNKTSTSFSESFIKLSLSAYLSSSVFNGLEIGEAGLFSKEKDNNCLARVVFSPFTKKEDEVIDIQWDITLLSYGMTKYPEVVTIDGPNKIKIPLKYSPYHIVTVDTGLYYNNVLQCIHTYNGDVVFTLDENNIVNIHQSIEAMSENTSWNDDVVKPLDYEHFSEGLYDIYKILSNSRLKDNQFYFTDKSYSGGSQPEGSEEEVNPASESTSTMIPEVITEWDFREFDGLPTHFYLGESIRIPGMDNLLADSEGFLLVDSDNNLLTSDDPVTSTTFSQRISMSYIYKEEITYKYNLTGYTIIEEEGSTSKYIIDANGNKTNYIVKSNEIYVADKSSESGYTSTSNFLSLSPYVNETMRHIIDEDGRTTGYLYDSLGCILVQEVDTRECYCTEAYLVWKEGEKSLSEFCIYDSTESGGKPFNTEYWINWTGDKEVYAKIDDSIVDTLFHVTNDNYFAIGETHRLVPVITPSDATDKSVTWSIVNPNISKINQNGILHGWNLGETFAYVTTTNNVRSRIAVEVVKDSSIIHTNKVTVDPASVTLKSSQDVSLHTVISAIVDPAESSYNIVRWTIDTDAAKIITFESLSNNKVRVHVNGSGNVGRGYITATTADGKSASCLIQVSTVDDNNIDCGDDYHDQIII